MVSRSRSSMAGRATLLRRGGGQQLLVVAPPVARALQGDDVLDGGALAADAVDQLEVVGVRADHPGAAVAQDVLHLRGVEPVVDGHEHGADLGHAVERLQVGGGVRRDVRDAVALPDAQPLQRRGPAVAALAELRVGAAHLAVDHGLALRVQGAGPAHELERRECGFHRAVRRPAPGSRGRAGGCGYCWSVVRPRCPTVLRSTPTPSSSISTTSPGRIALVVPGVPVKIMSPASRVM